MKEYILNIGQEGFSAGEAFLIKKRKIDNERHAVDAEKETALLNAAVDKLKAQFSEAASRESSENAEIYEAEIMLLEDAHFVGKVQKYISDDGCSAVSAIARASKELEDSFAASENSYIRHRREDIRGLSDQIISTLSDVNDIHLPENAIIIAEELSPAALSLFDKDKIRGIVTEKGSPTSHVSIMAGNMGVPYLYGSPDAVLSIENGDRLILDGCKMLLAPDEDTFQEALKKADALRKEKLLQEGSASTRKSRTRIYANIAGPQDTDALLASDAEGVGLFRSEFLFLNRDTEPTEEEQFDAYKCVVSAMGEKETIIRTMDIGSDKKAKWLALPQEKNPALGCRGLRVSLNDEHLLNVQLRALLRAAAFGNLKIMVPMVASVWEVEAVRTQIEKCAAALEAEGIPYTVPPLGIMVETPAAVVIADELAEKSAFFSIGTNDLTQYTLALDREAQGMERYYDPCHEAVMRMIEMTIAAGHRHNIPVAICGELAGNEKAVERLVAAGIDELSVSIAKIKATKAAALKAEEKLGVQADALVSDAEGASAIGQFVTDDNTLSKTKSLTFASPADGKLIPMQDIPDKAFSGGTLGKCIGILPDNGAIFAPFDGTVSSVAETKHAITISASDGRNILIHAGIDTVNMGGKGFSVLVSTNDAVHAGQQIMEIDLAQITAAGYSPMIIVVNLDES